jgi:16S rRNA (adenine1518-N6/adenine1519-N6)-dimethyltransferase
LSRSESGASVPTDSPAAGTGVPELQEIPTSIVPPGPAAVPPTPTSPTTVTSTALRSARQATPAIPSRGEVTDDDDPAGRSLTDGRLSGRQQLSPTQILKPRLPASLTTAGPIRPARSSWLHYGCPDYVVAAWRPEPHPSPGIHDLRHGTASDVDRPSAGRCHTDRVTHGRSEIHELLLANGLRPSRALGQNFVADGNTVRRIARLAGVEPGAPVVEIGAGLGSLTLALVEAGAEVTAIEVDRYVLPVLRSQVEPFGVTVVEADARTLDFTELLGDRKGWSLVANLPYNVAVPLVIRVLEEAPQVASLLVMVQREVGERLAARARDEAYGAVSVKVAYWARASVVGKVPSSVFIPRPRVESVLVRMDRRPDQPVPTGDGQVGPGDPGYERLFAVVKGGFAHRRKMLRRSLEQLVVPAAFEAAGIAPTARAEELDLEEWERLAWWHPDPLGTT